MKIMITSLLVLVLVLSLAACGTGDNTDNRINVPKSSTELKGEDYKDVMKLLQVSGFTNIETEVLDDLITGWLTKDGEVEKVSINGDTDFSTKSKYSYDSKIVITYHTFPSKKTEDITETTKVPENTEASGDSDGRNVSGFDTKTNQTIAWCGIDFSVPSYFDVLDKGSTKTWMTFYPEKEDYYSSIMFQSQEFSGTEEDFKSQIPTIVESIKDGDGFANMELQKSEEISIAGLPGWTITYSKSNADGDGVISTGRSSFAYNIKTGEIVLISCVYDSNDQSQYDYLGDYQKILETAKLLAEPIDLNANNSTNSIETALDANFPVENAKRSAVVAITNGYATDVFKKDGNTYDVTKFHSYADTSGNIDEYFFKVNEWGTWTVKNEQSWHVDSLILENTSGIVANASLDVNFDGNNYVVSNITGTFGKPGALAGFSSDLSDIETGGNANTYLTVSAELIKDDRNQAEVDALDHSKDLDKYVARNAFEKYGKSQYPYGFKCHWILDLRNEEQTSEGSWIFKVGVTITNQYGTDKDTVVEGTISGSTANAIVEDFYVY